MTRAYALAQALVHAGHSIEIVGVKLSNGPIYPAPPQGILVLEATGTFMIQRVWKLLTLLDGDVIYAIKPRPSSYGVALIKRLISGCSVVLDIDDWELGERELTRNQRAVSRTHHHNFFTAIAKSVKVWVRGLLRINRWSNPNDDRYIRWLERAIPWANVITVNTRFLHNYFGGTYIPHCKDINAYDPEKYDSEESRLRYGLADRFVLMFPGTARPHKGLEDLLVAIEAIKNPEVRLVLVGGRSSNDSYVNELLDRWGAWIVRLPTFPADEMPRVIAAAHVIVIPQRDTSIARAQFPMKLADAMAMSKPILTTTVGDIPEILGGTGFMVQPSNPEELEKMLTHLLKESHTAGTRGMQARARFVENYSLSAIGPTLSAVIEALP